MSSSKKNAVSAIPGKKSPLENKGAAKPTAGAPLKPCDKAFNQETARLEDRDEACDDGVK
jgi:hypothetical protein